MFDARFSHLYFCQSLYTLQRGLPAIAGLLVRVAVVMCKIAKKMQFVALDLSLMIPVSRKLSILQTIGRYKCASLHMWFIMSYYHKIFSFTVLQRWLVYDCETECSFVYFCSNHVAIRGMAPCPL